MIRVRVLKEGISILGKYTEPSIGVETEISDDEWLSEDVQKLVEQKAIERVENENAD